MSEPILSIRGLTKSFGPKQVLKGVDLTVMPGEIVGLIGESGAGKSTLGLAAMGYVKPGCRITGGSIRFEGQELVGAPASRLRDLRGRRIAYVAQSSAASFNPAWRLIDQYCEAPVQHGVMSRAEAAAGGDVGGDRDV